MKCPNCGHETTPHHLNTKGVTHRIFQCGFCEIEVLIRPWIIEYIKPRVPRIPELNDTDYKIVAYQNIKELFKEINE